MSFEVAYSILFVCGGLLWFYICGLIGVEKFNSAFITIALFLSPVFLWAVFTVLTAGG